MIKAVAIEAEFCLAAADVINQFYVLTAAAAAVAAILEEGEKVGRMGERDNGILTRINDVKCLWK